jgi:hypothetical protein
MTQFGPFSRQLFRASTLEIQTHVTIHAYKIQRSAPL